MVIDGDKIFAEIQEYTTKDPKDCRFETHRKYYDIQYVAEGEEFFGYIPLSELEEDTGYDPERDLEFYKEPENPGWIHLRKGDFCHCLSGGRAQAKMHWRCPVQSEKDCGKSACRSLKSLLSIDNEREENVY